MKLNEAVTFVSKHWVLTSNALRASLCVFGFRSITLQGEVQHTHRTLKTMRAVSLCTL